MTVSSLSHEQLDPLIEKIGALPIGQILQDLLQTSATALQVERVSYWALEDEGESIRRSEQYYLSRDEFDSGTALLRSAEFPVYFSAFDHGSGPIVSNDALADPRLAEFRERYLPEFGIRAMLDSPVRRQGRLFGVI
jgi:two-component system NtrC family sensor kinase